MKKIPILLMLACFATGLQAQIVARQPGGGLYKPVLNKNINKSFLSDREKLQLLQASPSKPGGMSNATTLGAKSTIGICTSDNPGMMSVGTQVNYVDKNYMSILNDGWLCLVIGGVEKGYYAIEVNLLEGGIDEFYVSLNEFLKGDMKKNRANNKLVFMQELQGGVVNRIYIQAVNKNIAGYFYFSNAQVSKINNL